MSLQYLQCVLAAVPILWNFEVLTGVYPILTRRRSSSSAIVAMSFRFRFPAPDAVFVSWVMTGRANAPCTECLANLAVWESVFTTIVNIHSRNKEGGKGRVDVDHKDVERRRTME